MCRPADEQQSFYHNLMVSHDTIKLLMSNIDCLIDDLMRLPLPVCLQNQLTSRLQESDSRQEVEGEKESRRSSLSMAPDCSQSSQSSQSPQSSQTRRKQQSCGGDPVVSATLRQLQQLGVSVDEEDLTESDRRIQKTVESSRYGPHLVAAD